MADSKISALPSASVPLTGSEVLPIVQGGATDQVTIANVTAGRAVSALSYSSTTGATFATTSGSVGIGTTLVPDKLSVLGNTTGLVGIRATNNNSTGTDKYINMFAGGTSTGVTAWNNSGVIESAVGTNLVLSGYNGTIIFQTGTSRVTQMSVNSTGIVTMAAYGAGTATFSATGVISSVSDETWKIKDGAPSNPTEMLNKLEPGYWYYNDKHKDTFGVDRQLGFYAQNVNAAIGPEAAPPPESFTVTDDKGVETLQQKPWGYYDRSVLAVVVMALQEALATVKTLEVRIQALEVKS